MDRLGQQYAGFYRFAKLLENLVAAIADGRIDIPNCCKAIPNRRYPDDDPSKIPSSNGFCGQDFAPANEVEMSKLCNQLS